MRSQNEILKEELQEKLKSESKFDSQTYKLKSFKCGPAKRQAGESFQAYKARMIREKQMLRARLRGFQVWFSFADHSDKYGSYSNTYRRDLHGKLPKMKIV